MSLMPEQETMIGMYLDDQFYKTYGCRVGPGDFARLCNTAKPEALQIEPIQAHLTETLSLKTPGDRDMTTPMPEILLRIAQDCRGEVGLARSCGGCRGKVTVVPEGFQSGEAFCVLAMINVLREAGVGVHQLRVVLNSVRPVGKQNRDFTEVDECRHEFK